MPAERRRTAAVLLALMVVATLLETLSVALVTPVLAFMSQGNTIARKSQLNFLFASLGHFTHVQLLAALMLILVVTYAVKTVYLAYIAWRQAGFVFSLQLSISQQLFEGYLRQPYTFHLQRNSAQMVRNVITETSQFSHVALIPGMTLLSEGLVLLGIGSLLVVVEPLGAVLVVFMIGSAGYVFHRLTRTRLYRWGEARERHEGMRIQHLQQGLSGAKEVKLLGRESQFIERYSVHDAGVAKVQERQLTLQTLPRLWIELLAVTGLAALVLTMLAQGKLSTLVPTLGLFAAAAFRLMPSTTKVLTSVQSLRYSEPVINTLTTELSMLAAERTPKNAQRLMSFDHALLIEGVSYRYPDAESDALRDVNLMIRRGSAVGFIGGSGAGKSTLIDVVLGLLTPTRGKVTIDSQDIQANLRGWQDKIGYVPQSIYLTDDTIRCNVAFGLPRDRINDEAVWRALRAAQLEEFVRELPEELDAMVGERGVRLSGGQRQRIGIARALYHDPAVLVLDEATSALDVHTDRRVIDAVKALRGAKTILIVAHRISTVEHCDNVVRLEQGVIVQKGDPREVISGMSQGDVAQLMHRSN
jgi:ABC-type multidrug transport system fused ATPase/permease subunit